MKRVLIFVFCLIAFGLMAQVIYQPHRRNAFRIGCSTYNTTNAWDNFIEGFQAVTGYESNGWSHVGTSANITSNYNSSALTTYKPEGACNQCLHVVAPNDGTETFARMNLGAAIDIDTIQTDIYFSFYIQTGLPSDAQYCWIAGFGSTTAASSVGVAITNDLGVIKIRASAANNTTFRTISAGQWYVVKISLDTAKASFGSSYTVWSNGLQILSDTFTRAAADIQYLGLGAVLALDAGETFTIDYDLLCIKTN